MSEFKDIIEANFREYRKQFQSAGLIIVASLILIGLFTAVYTVQAEMQGVVLRFGKFITTVEPGLRFKFPFGIDRVQMVPVRRQLKQEFGFGTQGASNNSQYSSPREWEHEKNMVTGDLNAASVEWIVQYRINDPRQFLFNVREPGNTLRAVSESVMREVVGDRTVDEVITIGRQEIEVVVLQRLQELVNKYEMGLSIIRFSSRMSILPNPFVPPSMKSTRLNRNGSSW